VTKSPAGLPLVLSTPATNMAGLGFSRTGKTQFDYWAIFNLIQILKEEINF
jgi:hypothetical protein